MAEHPNAEIVRSFFRAQADADVDGLMKVLSGEIVWRLPRGGTRLSDASTVRGIDQLTEMSARNFEASEGTFRFDVEQVFAGEEFAAVVSHNTATASGRSLDVRMAIQFRIQGDQIHEVWESVDDIDAFYDFWRRQ